MTSFYAFGTYVVKWMTSLEYDPSMRLVSRISYYLFHMSANEEREFLGEKISEIDKRLSVSRNSTENKNLRTIIFDMVRHVVQGLDVLQRRDELQSLR